MPRLHGPHPVLHNTAMRIGNTFEAILSQQYFRGYSCSFRQYGRFSPADKCFNCGAVGHWAGSPKCINFYNGNHHTTDTCIAPNRVKFSFKMDINWLQGDGVKMSTIIIYLTMLMSIVNQIKLCNT